MQLVNVELPAGESEFVGQAWHSPVPVDGLYFPATHAVQLPPSGPEKPTLHVQIELPGSELEFGTQPVQDVSADLPVCAPYLPAPHSWQVEFDEALCTVEYFPVPHSVQLADPVDSLYLPGSHAVHPDPA
jgi:hypothetical protein